MSQAGFYLEKASGTPTFDLTSVLYAHSGTFGTSSVPTGTALATSTAINATALPAGASWVYFNFDKTFTLVNGTSYCIAIHSSILGENPNFVYVYADNTAPTHPGNRAAFSGSWTAPGGDLIFRVHTVSVPPASTAVAYDSPNLTDGAATTNRLGAGTGSFVAGKVSEMGVVDNFSWTANSYTELLYSLALVKTDLVNGDTLRFRVRRNGMALTSYAQVPTINVTSAAPVEESYWGVRI